MLLLHLHRGARKQFTLHVRSTELVLLLLLLLLFFHWLHRARYYPGVDSSSNDFVVYSPVINSLVEYSSSVKSYTLVKTHVV